MIKSKQNSSIIQQKEEENYQTKISYDVKMNLTQIISLEETLYQINPQDLSLNK